jgi:hypothetical protein
MRTTTDREILLFCLEAMGFDREIEYEPANLPSFKYGIGVDPQGQDEIVVGGTAGYAGFFSFYIFDDEGNLIGHGAGE